MSATKRDEAWMNAYRHDDPGSFAHIYAAYGDPVYGYLVKRVRSETEREDLFQKIWLKFHRARDQWSPEYPLLQWLFVIARSVILDRHRARSRSPDGRLVDDSEAVLNRIAATDEGESSPESVREEAELADRLLAEGLSEEQVEIVRSRVFADEDYAEIAKRLGKSAVSVRKIFSRAIEKIRIARVAGGKR